MLMFCSKESQLSLLQNVMFQLIFSARILKTVAVAEAGSLRLTDSWKH